MRATQDGWETLGDLGWLDADGYLFLVDRRTDMIVTGGENVYPARVEAVLGAHPSVEEACVVGAPDPSYGARVVAVLRLRAPATEADLDRHCRARLARFEVPRSYVILGTPLPRTPAGKLARALVRSTIA
jgi:acyl-CoA synthetase (AMP-forming)/AMP-acid ligase II